MRVLSTNLLTLGVIFFFGAFLSTSPVDTRPGVIPGVVAITLLLLGVLLRPKGDK